MPSPAENQTPLQPDQDKVAESGSVQTRVSELLDDVTVMEEGAQPEAGDLSVGVEAGDMQPEPETEPSESEPAPVKTTQAQLDQQEAVPPSAIKIRGRPGGVSIQIGEGDWEDLLAALEARLDTAEGFFRGGRAVLELGARGTVEEQLRQVRTLLVQHDMALSVVKSTSSRTMRSALSLGLSTSGDVEEAPAQRPMAPVVPITQPQSPYFVHNGTLRSGQVLRKAESVVVVGDVNPGAQVISAGDVMVWGRLRGVAHAGAGGNKKAVVAAIEFAPTQLRIAGVTAVAPDNKKSGGGLKFWKKSPERRPEVASIVDGRIVVELWDDTRPGRPKMPRR